MKKRFGADTAVLRQLEISAFHVLKTLRYKKKEYKKGSYLPFVFCSLPGGCQQSLGKIQSQAKAKNKTNRNT